LAKSFYGFFISNKVTKAYEFQALFGMNSITYADSIVKEYLLFRGFNNTVKQFDQEKKNDKSKGFQVR
jgi:hypothetical protein